MPLWPSILALLGMFLTFVGITSLLIFGVNWQFLEKPIVANVTSIVVMFANILLVIATFASVLYLYFSNARAERLFVALNQPVIDVTPIAIAQSSSKTHAITYFSVVNYSGFQALNIGVDVLYSKSWIGEWLKARDDGKHNSTPGIAPERLYATTPNVLIDSLSPGDSTDTDKSGGKLKISGSLSFDEVCANEEQGWPILVRVTWQNEQHHTFDEIHKYRLICTKDTGEPGLKGRAFTFIPEGIISKRSSSVAGKATDSD